MRIIPFLLLLYFVSIGQLDAMTYSWVDDAGTYNFTEDLSSVPKKYRKRVNRRDDGVSDTSAPATVSEKKTVQENPAVVKSADVSDGDTKLYGGKTREAWRRELLAQESELNALKRRLELIQKQLVSPSGLSKGGAEALQKEYNETRSVYDQKYKAYSELADTVRKAGLPVEMK